METNNIGNVMVEIMIDHCSDGKSVVYAGVKLNDKICTDATAPNIESTLLQLIENMGEQIIDLEPFYRND